MYDRSFGRNDQKSSDLFKKIKFEIRDSICNLWDRIWKNARMLALFLYIFIAENIIAPDNITDAEHISLSLIHI